MLAINASIIPVSALGPAEYGFTASDLHTVIPTNCLCKYDNDTYLLVPSTNTQLISQELQHISKWASANNLNLNKAKSQEMIVYLPQKRRNFSNPSTTIGINRADKRNILGVTVSNTLTFSHHVTVLVEKCARSLYALRIIRDHGLAGNALFDVAQATTVAQLLYASPAWWGFLETQEKNRLQCI